MKEKIKNMSNKKIVITTLCAFATILLLGFTYAYWTRTFNQTGENVSTYDCFDLSFAENVNGISMENGYPVTDEEGLKTEAYEVTITNTCKTAASYNVVLNKLNTSTLDDSHVKVAVDSDIKLLSETKTTISTIANTSEARIVYTGVLAGNNSKTISIRSWMDENTSEVDGANKTLSYKISIEAVATNNNLNALILARNIKESNNINYKVADPIYLGSEYIEENVNLSASITGPKLMGTGYTFNEKTGRYSLTGIVENKNFDDSSIGLYTCNSTASTNCTTIFKVIEVSENKLTKVNLYRNEVTDKQFSQSGLYSALDDDGESFYYRGEINNNYVSFADKLWRIVRINGDKSIRLILEDNLSSTAYQANTSNEAKYVGYTYDNDHICTKNDPCTKESGTNSKIKNYIEEWYDNNLKDYDSKIALGNFCNDTTVYEKTEEENIVFNVKNRLDNGKPSLKCSDTNENYGGFYKLKIGLLTADEVNMAGFTDTSSSNKALETNYLYQGGTYFHTMSPYQFRNGNASVFASYKGFNNSITVNVFAYASIRLERPVINLKPDVKILSGNGTKNNPYIIE